MDRAKLIIVGKSGSGKDYLLSYLVKKGFKPLIKYTTRPMRNGEVDKETYNFVTTDSFIDMINKNEIIYQKFIVNNVLWYYGFRLDDFLHCDVCILTPLEVQLIGKARSSCKIVYLDISANVREERPIKRSDSNDSIQRRLLADEKDFDGFRDHDVRIVDSSFDCEVILK